MYVNADLLYCEWANESHMCKYVCVRIYNICIFIFTCIFTNVHVYIYIHVYIYKSKYVYSVPI